MARPGRKRKQKPTLPERAVSLGASPERVKQARGHIVVYNEPGKAQSVTIRMADSVIDRLLSWRKIDPPQHAAGERYFEDWYMSGLAPVGAMDYAKPVVDTSGSMTTLEFKEDARQRFNQATRSLGPLTQPIVDDVCLHGHSIAEVGDHGILRRNKRDKDAQAIIVLKIGLDDLAFHYGMKRKP